MKLAYKGLEGMNPCKQGMSYRALLETRSVFGASGKLQREVFPLLHKR